jgi:AcrR family transcriptional regulator
MPKSDSPAPSLPRPDRTLRTPRSPSAIATRQRLYAAGRTAFASKGLAGTKLKEDVLQPAAVSVGSFYHQFKDKTDLLLAILNDQAKALRARIREANQPRPGRSLHDIALSSYETLFDLTPDDESVARIHLRERDSEDPRVRAFLTENRRRWIRSLAADYERLSDSAGTQLDADLTATLIVGLSLAAQAEYFETPEADREAAKARLVEGLVQFTLGGVPGLAAGPKSRD